MISIRWILIIVFTSFRILATMFHHNDKLSKDNLSKDKDNLSKDNLPKDSMSKDESKAFKELPYNASIVILPAEKGRSTAILNHEDYLEKCMDYINNGLY